MGNKTNEISELFESLVDLNGKDFELRKEQIKMSLDVQKSLQNSEISLIEAGTGVGKSLAYLIPSILYSLETGKKIVISTETIALQNQLIQKDIPIAKKILNKDIKAEIALGSSNYLCKRRMDNTISSGNFGYEMTPYLNDFYAWEKNTSTGIKSEYRGFATPEFWSKITRDSENCLSRKCPNFNISYYFLEKEKWKNANILIVNHYLLASHIAGDLKILPEFQNLIIDEAHNFPDILGKSFRISILYNDILNLIHFISGRDKKNTGLLGKIDDSLKNKKLINRLNEGEEILKYFYGKLFEEFPVLFQAQRITKKINPDNCILENYLFEISTFLKSIQDKFNPETENILEKEIIMELDFSVSKSKIYAESLKMIRTLEKSNIVVWLDPAEENAKDKFYGINAQPMESGDLITEKLYPNMDSIIFTSATLSNGKNKFTFFKSQIGDPSTKDKSYPSPFPYSKNALLYLPKNIRDPVSQPEAFQEDIIKLLPYLINLSNGNAFVLFTSNKMMREVYNAVKESLNFSIFSQHELGAEKAKQEFLENEDSILFGVSTFWQGIDIKGDKLRSVIITKLPFQAPGEPVLEAKIESFKDKNSNPFTEIQLPHAILTLKQGFGRLIRSKTDKGFVAILDPRVQTKKYGEDLINNLPPAKIVKSFKALKESYSKL
jgi:ATP-dependent DNA helicase DinG